MAPSLRGRLVCFYCGSRSAQTRRPNLRSWQCEKCEAVNHLDEHGEITDPPASGDYSNIRYAHSIQRSTSPVIDSPDESLFCQTCLKNQHIFSETLAAYFPSQDAPNYAEFEKAYPAYRKDLEERYPQVCGDCAPRVQERIRATGYVAKTDHLRRMMERTRGYGVPREDSSWKSLLAFVGGTAWFMSLVVQVVWDVLVLSMTRMDRREMDGEISLSDCIQQGLRGFALPSDCTTHAAPVAGLALILGFLSCWWNPKLQEISRRRGGHMTGLSDYYKQQALLLAVRSIAYLYLERTPSSNFNSQITQGVHAFMLFFCTLLTIMSFRTVGIDYNPRVVFQDSPEHLIPRQAQSGTSSFGLTSSNDIRYQPIPPTASGNPGTRPFSINDLAPASRQQLPTSYQPPYQPPTPPPDDDDEEAMDWTPSQPSTLRPATLYQPSSLAVLDPQQNPFRGHLPADVVSQEHRLRNPPNKPTFRKASEVSKKDFFRTPRKDAPDFDGATDASTEYEPSLADTISTAGPKFADPKLHLQSDQTPVTGLERLLASTFSLSDEPSQIQAAQQREVQAHHDGQTFTYSGSAQWHRLPMLLLLTISYFVWTNTLKPSLIAYELQFRLAALFVAALASVRSLYLALLRDMSAWSGSDLMIFGAELFASITLMLAIRDPSEGSVWNARHGTLETAGSTLIAILGLQEMWMFSLDVRTALRDTKTPLASIPAPNPTDPAPLAAPPCPDQQPPARRRRTGASSELSSAVVQRDANRPRSTRSRAAHKSSAAPNSGFGGLSLGEDDDENQIPRTNSLSLGQPRRHNRNAMW